MTQWLFSLYYSPIGCQEQVEQVSKDFIGGLQSAPFFSVNLLTIRIVFKGKHASTWLVYDDTNMFIKLVARSTNH